MQRLDWHQNPMPISWICRWTLACFPRNLPINQGRDEGFSLSVYEFPCSANPPTWSFQHPRPSFLTKGIPTWGTTAPSYWPPAVRSKPPILSPSPRGRRHWLRGTQQLHWGRGAAFTLLNLFRLENSQHESIIPTMGWGKP